MSKSTNTKDLKSKIVHFRVMCDSDLADRDAGVITQDEYAKSIEHRLDILVEYLAKDRQQLIQRFREEVIGEDEELEPLNKWIKKTRDYGGTQEEYWRLDSIINNYNNLRQTQRETLETMEKEALNIGDK